MLAASLCLALLAPQGPANGEIVINEIAYDTSYLCQTCMGVDTVEFVELYNASSRTIDIEGWVLAGEDDQGTNTPYTITGPSTQLLPGQFYVLGSPLVANVTQLVGTPPHQDLWEDSNEMLILKDDSGAIIDTVLYEANKGLWPTSTPTEGQGIWGNLVTVEGSECSWQRVRDGWDNGNNGLDFVMAPISPGASINSVFTLTPGTPPVIYADDFDSYTGGGQETPLPTFGGSFVPANAVAPMGTSQAQPTPIAPSPQGGDVAIFWDFAGGGNYNMLLTEISGSVVFEAWVYFEAAALPTAAEYETWSIGFGASGSFHNHPDPSGVIGGGTFTANGNTGVAWVVNRLGSSGETKLWLMDHNEGGWGFFTVQPKILGEITIQAGVNDGWQRLRLELSDNGTAGTYVSGTFGGTLGGGGGTTFQGAVADVGPRTPNTFYVGYRERIDDNLMTRPPTMDDMRIAQSSSALALEGTAVPTNFGTPTIAANGPPFVGNRGFRIQLSGLVPSQATTVFVGSRIPGGAPIPIAQPGSTLWVLPAIVLVAPVDATGNAVLPVPIPANPAFIGGTISWQDFDVDASLAAMFALPTGNSARLGTTFGN